jgi:hypothetical protein
MCASKCAHLVRLRHNIVKLAKTTNTNMLVSNRPASTSYSLKENLLFSAQAGKRGRSLPTSLNPMLVPNLTKRIPFQSKFAWESFRVGTSGSECRRLGRCSRIAQFAGGPRPTRLEVPGPLAPSLQVPNSVDLLFVTAPLKVLDRQPHP